MKTFIFILPLFLSTWAFGYRVESVKVSGEDKASVYLAASGELPAAPAPSLHDNVVELSFPSGDLADSAEGKMDVVSPHALIQRISVFKDRSGLKARFVLNGSEENLKNRIHVAKDAHGYRLEVDFPSGQKETLSLLKEEQLPIVAAKAGAPEKTPSIGVAHIMISLIVIFAAGAATFFAMRFLKTKGAWKGSRKNLLEQMAYSPTGPKSGIAIMKVGSEFFLIGSTPQQITFLSRLPKLEAQYEDEAGFERGVFREAVAEEVKRMRKPGLEA